MYESRQKAATEALRFVFVALFYFLVAKLGLQLAYVHPSASPIWPATGVAIASVLLGGYRIAPAIFIGAFAANQLTAGSVFTSLGIASGNTLEALAAGYLVQRFGGGAQAFDISAGVVRFAVIAVFATIISAAFGTVSLALGGYVEADRLPRVALTWWLGDLAGAVVVTPVVLLWGRSRARLQSAAEPSFVSAYLGAVIVGFVAFTSSIPPLGTVTVTHWLGTDGPYSIRLWTSFHTAATAFRASSSSRPSGSISASL